jgi:four helix bundle protein
MSRLSEDLRQRTKGYASEVIRLYVQLPKSREEVKVLGRQLLRSGTSVAAHAREASRARSDQEFCSKLDGLLQEAGELMAIFITMVSKLRQKHKAGESKT